MTEWLPVIITIVCALTAGTLTYKDHKFYKKYLEEVNNERITSEEASASES